MLVLRELRSPPPSELTVMTFPPYRPLLGRIGDISSDCHAFTAIKDGKTVGLLLGRLQNDAAELLSIYVKPAHRNRGIATKLLKQFEKKVAKSGRERVVSSFSTAMPGFKAMKRVFEHSAWNEPAFHMKLVHFSMEKIGKGMIDNPRYSKYRNPCLPDGFSLKSWHELSAETIAEVKKKRNQADGWKDEVSPFREPDKLEKLNSLAILKNGNVVGWVINHRINRDTIRYTQLYNAPISKSMRGVLIQVVIHAFWLHYLKGPPKGCLIIYHWNTSLMKLFEKLMLKAVDSYTESYSVEKYL